MTNKILNFGSLNIDYVYHIDNFVKPGQTISSKSFDKHSGGKGNNQSIAIAKAGGSVYQAGIIGADGQFLLNNLNKNHVNTNYVEVNPSVASGHAIIQVDKNGENCIILHGGANQTIDTDYISQILNNFESNDILLIQNEISNLDRLIEQASLKNMQIYFNPSPMDSKILEYDLSKIHCFIINQPEAYDITSEQEPDKILSKMLSLYPNSQVILTLGSDGVIYQDKENKYTQDAFKSEVVDTTAAGDTFLGYYLASVQKGLDTAKALELAAKAASITITRHGATESIPDHTELNLGP